MGDDSKIVVKNVNSGSATFGPVWFFGWLFTIGYLHLGFDKGLFALILWPYYLGVHFAHP